MLAVTITIPTIYIAIALLVVVFVPWYFFIRWILDKLNTWIKIKIDEKVERYKKELEDEA
jgi:hypothetical protein